MSVANSLEIDVMQAKELPEAVELAVQANLPALVVHPELIAQANMLRLRRQGRFKIITPVDWPKGDRIGVDKFMHLSVDAMDTDGFEIILNEQKSVGKALLEIKPVIELLRTQMRYPVEIRFCLEATDRPETSWLSQCEAFNQVPGPNYIRTTHHVSLQQAKASATASAALVGRIRSKTAKPIKVSGNVGNVKTMAACRAERYGVNLKQAQDILAELQQFPTRYDELLATAVSAE